MNKRKLLARILNNSRNIKFPQFQRIVMAFGFVLDRIDGSHHIYKNPRVREIINIQNVSGEAKPYQIKQFLALVEQYQLSLED